MEEETGAFGYHFFVLMSFAGWIWEVAIHLVEDGVFVKRGVLSGPWLPNLCSFRPCVDCIISGKIPAETGQTLSHDDGTVRPDGIYDGLVSGNGLSGEMVDYSDLRFQIQGRVCLAGLLIFGAGGYSGTVGASGRRKVSAGRNQRVLEILCLILVFLFTADLLQSLCHIQNGRGDYHCSKSGMSSARVP